MKKPLVQLISALALSVGLFGFNDQDSDGLSDELEVELGLDPTKSSYFPDSDGDGFVDYIELFYRSDPGNRMSHPPFGTPFGISGINASEYWNTVDMWGDSAFSSSWILLLGDGSVVTISGQYTPIRPVVKVACPDPDSGHYLGIQADGTVLSLGDTRDGTLIAPLELPYRLPITPNDQVISLGDDYSVALANQKTNEIRIFPFLSNYNSDHIFTATGSTILQADEDFVIARATDGNVFLREKWALTNRFDIDLSWATHIFLTRGDLIAISKLGKVFELPDWQNFLSEDLDGHHSVNTIAETTPFSSIPDYNFEFAAVRAYGDDLIAVLIEGAWIFRLTPGSEWQNIGRFNFTGILDAATTEINFTDSQAIMSYFDPNEGFNGTMKFRMVSLQDIGLKDNASPSVTSIPEEFQQIFQLDEARTIIGNRDGIIIERWSGGYPEYSVIYGNEDLPRPNHGFVFYSPSWGLMLDNDDNQTGVADTWEARYNSNYGVANQVGYDTDGDGIEGVIESFIGLDPYSTDSNDDGIPDKVEFFRNFPTYFGSPEQLNPYLRASLLSDTFLTSETAETAGFINESEAITTKIIQPDISLGANTIFMEWSVMESDDLMNWEQTDSFIIEKELSDGKQFFRVLMSE